MTGLVDQLLFGYRDGHELLAGSLQPSPGQLLEILPHVDATVESADDRQLVGVWIDQLDRYLIARIWPAPERPRPGAVWAHGLLLTGEQIATGRLAGLPGLLRRPVPASLGAYRQRLAWPSGSRLVAAPPLLARALAQAVRAADKRPRIVLWPAPIEAEGALLALLDALPAATRRELSFRTRGRVRGDSSAYRLQVATGLSSRASAGDVMVLEPGAGTAARLGAVGTGSRN